MVFHPSTTNLFRHHLRLDTDFFLLLILPFSSQSVYQEVEDELWFAPYPNLPVAYLELRVFLFSARF